MPLERLIRDGLREAASDVEVQVERDLRSVVGAAHRYRRRQRLTVALVACAALVAGIVAAPTVRDLVGAPERLPPAERNSRSDAINPERRAFYALVAGTYTTTLPRVKDAPYVRGRWRMRLGARGDVYMHGPRAFEKIFGSGYVTYFGRASSFLISGFVAAHCSGPPGAYRWTLGAERLTLVPTDEECWIRRAVLATRPWVRS